MVALGKTQRVSKIYKQLYICMCEDLMTAFMWASTIEGHDFWKNIYNKRFTK